MADEYRDALRDDADPATAPDPSCAPFDVEAAFARIPQRGTPFRCAVAPSFFTGTRAERYREVSNPGLNRSDNHLQGVQRHGDRYYLSAGDLMEGRAHLFVARASASPEGAAGAELTRIVCVDDRRDHGGGIQRAGNVLAIAIEGNAIGSTIAFLQLDDPDRPAWIPGARIDRVEAKASGAALTTLRLPGGDRVLAGVTWLRPARFFGLFGGARAYLDLYLSRTTDIREGFVPGMLRLDASRLLAKPPPWQSIAFFPSLDDRDVMLIGSRSTSSGVDGRSEADLCRLRFTGDVAATWPKPAASLVTVATRGFTFERGYGDFAAAAGFDATPGGGLVLIAGAHFRHPDGFRLSVFATPELLAGSP